ncbi:MAG: cell division protein FtsQ/DivIB [Gaiellaceae bacterium]
MAKLADAVVLRVPHGRGHGRVFVRVVPSWRWLAIAFGVVLAVGGGYLAARDSALFAVRRVEIQGAPPAVALDVRGALRPLEGDSLLRVDLGAVGDRLAAIPSVRAARFDRAFPHTLLVTVAAERPVAVLRTGDEAWLVSARGRVIRRLENPRLSRLPRVWAPAAVSAAAGDGVTDGPTMEAVRALAAVADSRLPARVRYARSTDEGLTLMLMAGTELELANDDDLALKLAVARTVLLALDPARQGWPAYVDLTVPGRPVVGFASSQVQSET